MCISFPRNLLCRAEVGAEEESYDSCSIDCEREERERGRALVNGPLPVVLSTTRGCFSKPHSTMSSAAASSSSSASIFIRPVVVDFAEWLLKRILQQVAAEALMYYWNVCCRS
jgi:hypothetical protein